MKIISAIIGLSLALQVGAQINNNVPTFIKGNMQIQYNTRVKPGELGVTDNYKINMNISNSTAFNGEIKFLPVVPGTLYGISQNASLAFEMDCDVINPANPKQTKKVARLYGKVPITPEGAYQFDQGNVVIGLIAQGTESKFTGLAQGKPLIRQKGWFESLQQEALSLTRGSKGKVVVKKYDKMVFQSHKIPAGPISMYPESIVNGEMIYDYDRYVWYFNNVTITYHFQGGQRTDKLTGNIRWVEHANRKNNGEGEYQFDVHINEPPANEASMFANAVADEASFFATDSNYPALTGTMKYKDTIVGGEKVTASLVTVDLVGQKLDKQQVMNLYKLLFFTAIVPMNAE